MTNLIYHSKMRLESDGKKPYGILDIKTAQWFLILYYYAMFYISTAPNAIYKLSYMSRYM